MGRYTPVPAERYQAKLRMALAGPPGSGKTLTSLLLAGAFEGRICLIDGDRGASQLYANRAGVPVFDVIILEEETPEHFLEAIEAATGYDVLIIDNISREWWATLATVDEITANSRSQNAYTQGWAVATPRHNRFIRAMFTYPGHVIATIQQKIKHVLKDVPGQGLVPTKVGWEWVQRDLLELEPDLCAELDGRHTLTVVKTRYEGLDHRQVHHPDAAWMREVIAALTMGKPLHTLQELLEAIKQAGYGEADLVQAMGRLTPGVEKRRDLNPHQITVLYEYFTAEESSPTLPGQE